MYILKVASDEIQNSQKRREKCMLENVQISIVDEFVECCCRLSEFEYKHLVKCVVSVFLDMGAVFKFIETENERSLSEKSKTTYCDNFEVFVSACEQSATGQNADRVIIGFVYSDKRILIKIDNYYKTIRLTLQTNNKKADLARIVGKIVDLYNLPELDLDIIFKNKQ